MLRNKIFSTAYKYKLHHILLWMSLYCWFILLYRGNPDWRFLSPLIYEFFIALAIYITLYLLIPYFLNNKKFILFILFTLSVIVICCALQAFVLHWMDSVLNPNKSDFTNYYHIIYDVFTAISFYTCIAVIIKIFIERYRERNYLQILEKDKMAMELNSLKAQINPHFLLNSLNTIYYKIDRQNTEARDILMKFSEMLKYQLYDCNTNEIRIEKELEYLKNYVNLQKLRLNNNYKVDFSCADGMWDAVIAPHLLIPFVENAFKHVSHHEEKPNEIKIEVTQQNDELMLLVFNTKEHKAATNEQGGIGLTNVKKRLLLLYPGKHDLEIKESEDNYEVKLKFQVS